MRIALLAALLVVSSGLAGCFGAAPTTATPFDGEAALDWVEQFALNADGTPRYRIPGTAGQTEGAKVLWDATGIPGWSRSWHNLTGADYLNLDRSAVAAYGPGSPYCRAEDEARLPNLPFANLLAIRRSADSAAPLVLLGAHWDSQLRSDNDPDPAKRNRPDPGANDGASGVGVLLQLMRHLDGVALPFDLGILFLDGEDGFYSCHPLAGSLHFAQNRPEPVAAFVLLDMVGDPGARFPKESRSVASAPELVRILWSHGQAAPGGAQHFLNRSQTIVDDHVAFANEGIPSVDIIDAGRDTVFPPQWNTAGDTVDKLDAAMLGRVGEVLVRTLGDPAFTFWLGVPASA
ncbi:MAG: M28 family peptidase [Candidatus Thermoplasmatota archaeon]